MFTKPVHFGLSLPPIGPSMGEIGAKVMDSFASVPVTNIPGPPSSFYTDSFQYIRNKKGNENSGQENKQENKDTQADPQDTIQASQGKAAGTATPERILNNSQETLSIPESATLANSPSAVQNDMLTAQQYDQSLNGYQAIQDVSPV